MNSSAKRVPLWDNLRFALIFVVILGHLAEYHTGQSAYLRIIFFYIYTFHMPAFIFLSGLFSKSTVNNKNYGRVFSYFVLYVFIKIISYLSSLAINGKASFTLLSEGGIPWYALALFWFSLLTIFLKRFNPVYVFVAGILLGCFAGYDDALGDKLVLLRTIVYFPFFFAGYCLDADKLVAFVKKKAVIAVAAVIMAALFAVVYFGIENIYPLRPLLSGRNPFTTLPDNLTPYGGLLRAAYYIISFILIGCLIALTPQKETFLTPFGSRTVQAYSLQIVFNRLFVVYIAPVLIEKLGISSAIFAVDLIPTAIIIAMLCSLKILEKPFNLLLSPGKAKA